MMAKDKTNTGSTCSLSEYTQSVITKTLETLYNCTTYILLLCYIEGLLTQHILREITVMNIKAVWNVISFICLYTEDTTLHGGVLMGDCWSLHFHSLRPDITRGSDSAEINLTLMRCQDQTLNKWMGWCHEHLKGKTWDRRVQGWMEIHLFICSCPYTEANNFTWWCHGVNTHRLW